MIYLYQRGRDGMPLHQEPGANPRAAKERAEAVAFDDSHSWRADWRRVSDEEVTEPTQDAAVVWQLWDKRSGTYTGLSMAWAVDGPVS